MFNDKYYIGIREDNTKDVFAWPDGGEEATPENTGYVEIIGSFETKEEAEENL